jgi:hypothetical protein
LTRHFLLASALLVPLLARSASNLAPIPHQHEQAAWIECSREHINYGLYAWIYKLQHLVLVLALVPSTMLNTSNFLTVKAHSSRTPKTLCFAAAMMVGTTESVARE